MREKVERRFTGAGPVDEAIGDRLEGVGGGVGHLDMRTRRASSAQMTRDCVMKSRSSMPGLWMKKREPAGGSASTKDTSTVWPVLVEAAAVVAVQLRTYGPRPVRAHEAQGACFVSASLAPRSPSSSPSQATAVVGRAQLAFRPPRARRGGPNGSGTAFVRCGQVR